MAILAKLLKVSRSLKALACRVLIVFSLATFTQMLKPNALRSVAGMKQITWPNSVAQKPDNMVGIENFSTSAASANPAISGFVTSTNPKPTTISFMDFFPKSLAQRPSQHGVSIPCDESLWKRVYKPERLQVHSRCVSVTGTIVDATHGKRKDGVRKEADGDCHGWVKLDGGQEKYLNAGNMSGEDGNLVYEVVCLFPVSQKDAVSACKGYKNKVKLAPIGSHVRITGSWVKDDNHAKWFELHPVSSIEVIH